MSIANRPQGEFPGRKGIAPRDPEAPVQCPSCGKEGKAEQNYCGGCGHRLREHCSSCLQPLWDNESE